MGDGTSNFLTYFIHQDGPPLDPCPTYDLKSKSNVQISNIIKNNFQLNLVVGYFCSLAY